MLKSFSIRVVLLVIAFCLLGNVLIAQRKHVNINKVYVGEIGAAIGAANYYGDLNVHGGWDAPKFAGSVFYRYFIGDYFGASIHIDYAQLGYSDSYNTNDYRHRRNLSFNTSVLAFGLQGDFNFFRFEPGNLRYRFTPYLSLGIGAFHFNPYTYYHGNKYYLQPLGTEGQGSAAYPDREKYSLWSWEVPLEFGLKFNLNQHWNIFLSASYRFTGTDYLDDVSKTYAGQAAFQPMLTTQDKIAFKLQDRSGVYGKPIGQKNRPRGNSRNSDQYVLIQIGMSYLFTRYRCP